MLQGKERDSEALAQSLQWGYGRMILAIEVY
jgi:hypothetical protein